MDMIGQQQALESEIDVSADSIVAAAQSQISSDVAGEAIILDLKAGIYYGLDTIATRIWTLIQQPRSVSYLLDTLLEEYEVDSRRCEQDLLVLLRQLAVNKLITIQNESIASLSSPSRL